MNELIELEKRLIARKKQIDNDFANLIGFNGNEYLNDDLIAKHNIGVGLGIALYQIKQIKKQKEAGIDADHLKAELL
ncbi:hypothetical protein LCGC14_1499190 [marine sediment metagenome]|uniref:Uncharacterized protein n=1 Tax=marine sediment metagenome TaxID=412755 RepID=A0A0F9JQF0_9ZZZZ